MRLYADDGQRLYVNATERDRIVEVAAALECPKRLFCMMLLNTGCRLSEATALRVRDIQVDEGVVSILSLKKRGRRLVREVPISPKFATEIADYIGTISSPNHRLWCISRSTGWRWVKAVMNDAGIAGLRASPKGLRHGFGVHCVMRGIPVFLIQKWLGHEKLETTQIYASVMGAEERVLARRLWDKM